MKIRIVLALFSVLTSGLLFAQEETGSCGTNRMLQEILDSDPKLKAHYEAHQLLQNSQITSTNAEGKSTVSYEIPVVFHIIHEYGTENISDAQVYDALEVFNREFNAADPDSVDLVPEFDTLNGNAHITFKLAALDPYGNCTNGIDRIYSHETNVGDSYSKLNQWDRSHYLNIWVVKIVGVPGAAAYATFPASTDGSGFWRDGVLSNHTYVGSIGTGSTGSESTLTHEIGHWLGLQHTFGDSDLINDGPTICNDDGILDTPPTKGHQHCNFAYPTEWIDCDTTNGGVVEDIQNYMDYSYCDRHFTPGQCLYMRNVLTGIAGQRNTLWQDSTLIDTGIKDLLLPQDPNDPLTVPLCAPVADFNAADKFVCVGSNVSFEDHSWNAVIDSWSWEFQDATPSTSTSANPTVAFNTPGWKEVTLTVTNSAGSDTREETKYIYVSADGGDNYGPTMFDMENENSWATGTGFFLVNNIENNYGSFGVVSNHGYDGTKAFKLQTFKDIAGSDPFTAEFFYNSRLGGSVDQLITPSIDMQHMSNVEVSFQFAYATNATVTGDITEELRVYTSKDCGETWTPRVVQVNGQTVGSTITGDDIVTAGYASNSDFAPTTNSQWATATFSYNPNSQDNNTRIMFEFTASDVASNLYIDNINVNGTLGANNHAISDLDLTIYPNPSAGEAINVSFMAQDEATTFTLRDAQGKVIAAQVFDVTNTPVNAMLSGTENLPAACYFLEVASGEHTTVKKVIVM